MSKPRPEKLIIDPMPTPVGEAIIVVDEAGYPRLFQWTDESGRREGLVRRYYPDTPIEDGPAPPAMRAAIEAYFAGDIHALETIAWRSAGTAFQESVWRALCDIPVGATISYGELARRINNPKAVRAVGLANGANPNGLIVPCHRVIGANGTLTGYGGGLPSKKWLLKHEGARFVEERAQPTLI